MMSARLAATAMRLVLSYLVAIAMIQHGAFFYGYPDPSKLVPVPPLAYTFLASVVFLLSELYAWSVRTEAAESAERYQ